MIAALLLALHGAALGAARDELAISPVVVQEAALFLSGEVTAGGAGGGLGVQLEYRELFLAQLDATLLFGLGNATVTRASLGLQRRGEWTPAMWLSGSVLLGDRMEFLTGDGARPALPTWSVGVRAAPLRWSGGFGAVSLLEPGLGTDFAGGLWLELVVLQAGARF